MLMMPSGCMILGDTILVTNKACEKLTGYTRKELVGMKVNQFFTPESLAVSTEMKRKLVAGEAFPQPYEQQLVRKDGVSPHLKGSHQSGSSSRGISRDFSISPRM